MAERHLCVECNTIVDSDHDPMCGECNGTGEVNFPFGPGTVQCLHCHGMGYVHAVIDDDGDLDDGRPNDTGDGK